MVWKFYLALSLFGFAVALIPPLDFWSCANFFVAGFNLAVSISLFAEQRA